MSRLPTIGQMTQVIKWERVNKASDSTGGQDEQFVDWFTGRGYLKRMNSFRKFNSGYDESVNVYQGWVMWRSELETDLTKDIRIVFDNRILYVQSYNLINEKRKMYELELKEVR